MVYLTRLLNAPMQPLNGWHVKQSWMGLCPIEKHWAQLGAQAICFSMYCTADSNKASAKLSHWFIACIRPASLLESTTCIQNVNGPTIGVFFCFYSGSKPEVHCPTSDTITRITMNDNYRSNQRMSSNCGFHLYQDKKATNRDQPILCSIRWILSLALITIWWARNGQDMAA